MHIIYLYKPRLK